jgi:sortase (surface protein transpeptidase)
MAGPSSPPKGGKSKSGDVAVVASLMGVLLVGMIALVLIVGREDKKPTPPPPASSVEAAIASASPSHPVVLIVDPASTDPPVVASEIPAPPVTTNAPEQANNPPSVPKYGTSDDPSNDPLNGDDINKVIDSHRAELKSECYSKITNVKSSAKVVIHIAKEGTVSGVDLVQSSGPDAVAKCVVAQAKTWVFPKAGTEANVQMPFFFR